MKKPGRPFGTTKPHHRPKINTTISQKNFDWLKDMKAKDYKKATLIDKALDWLRGNFNQNGRGK